LVGNYIKPDYSNDIYRYLYIDKHKLTKLLRYPKYIREIKNEKKKYKIKKNFRNHAKTFYPDDNNDFFKKVLIKKDSKIDKKIKIIEENSCNMRYIKFLLN